MMLGTKRRKDLTIGIVLPVRNCLNYTKQVFESLQTTYAHSWFILDNGSTDGTAEWAREQQEKLPDSFHYFNFGENIGVARAWNTGILAALEDHDVALVINNDLVFAPDTVDNLMEHYEGSNIVTVTNIGNDPERLADYSRKQLKAPATFIGFLIDSKVITRVGLFDEQFRTAYFEDDDYKVRCEAEGVNTAGWADALVAHYGSRTIHEGGVDHQATFLSNRAQFVVKHGFDPNLVLAGKKPTLLWVGDAVAPTGFEKVTRHVLQVLDYGWNIHVLGTNYHGDPHLYPWPVYPAGTGGDWLGIGRLKRVMQGLQPDITVIFNDYYNIADYLDALKDFQTSSKLTAYVPIDAENAKPTWVRKLNNLDLVLTYTEFGAIELTKSGLKQPIEIIPHGVDLDVFTEVDKVEARRRLGLASLEDWFWFGNINQNQPRKRQDLTLKLFAEWWQKAGKPEKVCLYLHCKTRGVGWDITQLAHYYGIHDHVVVLSDDLMMNGGIHESKMKYVYSALDVQLSTTVGEGWGLTQMEGMACRRAQVAPRFAALGEWIDENQALLVPIEYKEACSGNLNHIGGIVDGSKFVDALDVLYRDSEKREDYANKGLRLVRQPEFRWENIGREFHNAFVRLLKQHGSTKDIIPESGQEDRAVRGVA